jgi:gliding motility-associated lipoprotein GldD
LKLINSFFNIIIVIAISICILSCNKQEPIPKPKAFLRLEYPTPSYKNISTELPFSFAINKLASYKTIKRLYKGKPIYGLNIEYPSLKGTIYLTYKKVSDSISLRNYLIDAQKITLSHTQKADEITGNLFENSENKVFGMFYEIGGNAASQSQFYVTDSIHHFLNGSLYFYSKPNYDSILPVANYLKNDIKKMMETIRWK